MILNKRTYTVYGAVALVLLTTVFLVLYVLEESPFSTSKEQENVDRAVQEERETLRNEDQLKGSHEGRVGEQEAKLSLQVLDESTDQPVGHSKVTITPRAGGSPNRSVESTAGGRLVVSLSPGEYRITANREGYLKKTEPITLEAETERKQTIYLTPREGRGEIVRRLKGTVTNQNGRPLVGAEVKFVLMLSFDQAGEYRRSVRTDRNGEFNLPVYKDDVTFESDVLKTRLEREWRIPKGRDFDPPPREKEYYLSVTHEGYAPRSKEIKLTGTSERIEFQLDEGGVIEVSLKTHQGEPLSGDYRLKLEGRPNNRNVYVNPRGSISSAKLEQVRPGLSVFRYLPPGNYVIEAEGGLFSPWGEQIGRVTLKENERTNILYQDFIRQTITGRVLVQGQPVSHSKIIWKGPPGIVERETDADGYFTFENVPLTEEGLPPNGSWGRVDVRGIDGQLKIKRFSILFDYKGKGEEYIFNAFSGDTTVEFNVEPYKEGYGTDKLYLETNIGVGSKETGRSSYHERWYGDVQIPLDQFGRATLEGFEKGKTESIKEQLQPYNRGNKIFRVSGGGNGEFPTQIQSIEEVRPDYYRIQLVKAREEDGTVFVRVKIDNRGGDRNSGTVRLLDMEGDEVDEHDFGTDEEGIVMGPYKPGRYRLEAKTISGNKIIRRIHLLEKDAVVEENLIFSK